MADDVLVDPDKLRKQVRDKYREVALKRDATFHFHTGRRLAARAAGQRGNEPERGCARAEKAHCPTRRGRRRPSGSPPARARSTWDRRSRGS